MGAQVASHTWRQTGSISDPFARLACQSNDSLRLPYCVGPDTTTDPPLAPLALQHDTIGAQRPQSDTRIEEFIGLKSYDSTDER